MEHVRDLRLSDTVQISFWPVIAIFAMIFAVSYGIVRTVLILISEYYWYEHVFAFALLAAECFMIIHSIGYLTHVIRISRANKKKKPTAPNPLPAHLPSVAVVVPAYKEDPAVLRNTLACINNMSYPNFNAYLLDDTPYEPVGARPPEQIAYRKSIDELCEELNVDLFRHEWRGAKAGMINDFIAYMQGYPPEGSELVHHCGQKHPVNAKYLVIFDADQTPVVDFLEQLVADMEADPEMAFIQTPQYYWNYDRNRVARAAGFQQAVFYEYICEAKSDQNAMFCCGTNVIFRLSALNDVGGIFEKSVTEDFATGFYMHLKGWKSRYDNRTSSFGLGPEDLGGYYKQQFRWAFGTVSILKTVLASFIKNPKALPLNVWWEYAISSSYFLIGIVTFILVISPLTYLLFNIPSYLAHVEIYAAVFFPYMILNLSVFLMTLRPRGYTLKDVLLGQLLTIICFPVHLAADISALSGKNISFAVTPKGRTKGLNIGENIMQLACLFLTFFVGVWGLNRLYYEPGLFEAVFFNSIWCIYHFMAFCFLFYFASAEAKT